MSDFLILAPEGTKPTMPGTAIQRENARTVAAPPLEPVDAVNSQYADVLCWGERAWRKKGDTDSGRQFEILNCFASAVAGQHYGNFRVNEFKSEMRKSPVSGEMSEYRICIGSEYDRNHTLVKPGDFLVPAAQFCQQYEPDGWLSDLEWENILRSLEPVIKRDLQLLELEKREIQQRNEQCEAAAAERNNPRGFIVREIGAALAQALGPKPKAAK